MFTRKSAVIAIIACFVCPQFVFAYPDDDFTVSSGEQSATQKSGEIEFRSGTDPTSPFFTLSAESREALLMTGVDVLTEFIPGGPLIGQSIHLAVSATDSAIDAVDFKTEKVEGDLLALTDDANKLKELQRSNKGLQSKEAKEILARMEERRSGQNDEYSFLRKAVFSGGGLYVFARNAASEGLSDFLGEKLSKALGLDDAVEQIWKSGGTLRKGLKKKIWAGLKRRAEIGKKLTESLKESLLQAAAVDYLEKKIKEAFDELYRRILSLHPPTPGGRSEPADGLRLTVSAEPARTLPVLRAIPVQPAPQAIRPLIVPQQIVRYPDPVVSAVAVEDQVVRAQNYNVAPSSPSESERVRYPPIESANTTEPPPERDTPPEPSRTSIRGNFYVSPQSFDGNGKDLWH